MQHIYTLLDSWFQTVQHIWSQLSLICVCAAVQSRHITDDTGGPLHHMGVGALLWTTETSTVAPCCQLCGLMARCSYSTGVPSICAHSEFLYRLRSWICHAWFLNKCFLVHFQRKWPPPRRNIFPICLAFTSITASWFCSGISSCLFSPLTHSSFHHLYELVHILFYTISLLRLSRTMF